MATLIRALAVSGSRKSDGTANASGRVFLYAPGTTTLVAGYKDDELSEAWSTSGGAIALDSAGKVKIWVDREVDVVIADSSGTTVDTFLGFNKTAAAQVEVENDGWTGTLSTGSQGAGGVTNLDAVLTRLFASTGGVDGKYQESSGATARLIQDFIREVWISVKDFGAVGNGIADDTSAIQAAMNRVKARGGGVVYFPPGTYKVSSALTLSSADGVSLVGSGSATSIIRGSSGSANCFTFVECDSLRFRDLAVSHESFSTGTAFSLDTCLNAGFERVLHSGGVNSGFGPVLSLTDSTGCAAINCTFAANSSSSAGRGIVATNSGTLTVVGGRLGASSGGYPFEAAGTTSTCIFNGVSFSGGSARFAAGLSGSDFIFLGCYLMELSVATATIPVIRLIGSPPFESSASVATGAAVTPSLIGGNIVRITASGGAGTATVNAPTILPTVAPGQYWDFIFENAAGGAVTWSLNAVYRVTAAIPTTNGHTIAVRFLWDGSVLREVSRADTTT